jgi:hypothetical protein
MAAERVLVVSTVAADEEQLREQIPAGAEVRIVAPAARVSTLDWLTNDEDDARAEAAASAEETARVVGDKAAAVEVDRTSVNTDAAEDIRDALRAFPADEIVVVTSPGGDRTWLEDETVREALAAPGVPVRRVELSRD